MRSPRAAGAFPGSPADAPRGLHFQLFEIRRRAKHAGADAFATQDSERQAVTAISQGRARITAKGEGTPVMADKGAIRQIGVNLVTNAFKYSTGGIEIEVAGPEIRYMDRGPGIPRESEDRIFERFYRVDNSLAQATSGSGLGLPIARSLARGMGGDIVYSPRPGGGSVFTLKLKPAYGEPQNGEA